jgi:hypothetical protein
VPGQSPPRSGTDDFVECRDKVLAFNYVVHPSAWTKSFASIRPHRLDFVFFVKKRRRTLSRRSSGLDVRFSTTPLLHFSASPRRGRTDGRMVSRHSTKSSAERCGAEDTAKRTPWLSTMSSAPLRGGRSPGGVVQNGGHLHCGVLVMRKRRYQVQH